ncbi:MAG: hypothetical protein ACOC8S_02240 [Bacteroidota bacterium]
MIEEYKFGKMVIDGETYDKDLIITKDGEFYRTGGETKDTGYS